MKCHYEMLGVPREAEESEIKSAYKKLALRWHPDKNLDNPVEAKEQFQLVQQAYEVLCDRQERAWYDNHREQILRGSNKDYEDNCLDVFPYFTTACFSGYGDGEGGFYAVYSKVFESIAKDEMEYMEREEFCEIPLFGNSGSDYETTVTAFYNFWLGYSTRRSYVWVDPYQMTPEMRERRLLKLMEKENKKVRSKAKKERNEEVRNLVAFVRKRDKRVLAHSKVLEARAAENKLKQEEAAKQRRLARLKEIEQTQIGEWMKLDNVQSELREIERSMAKEFGEELSELSEEDDDDYHDDLFCIACSKLFKTTRAFENHEDSKKHKEKMKFLKETMLKEESELSREERDDPEADVEAVVDEDGEEEEEEEQEVVEESKKKKNKRRNKKVLSMDHHVVEEECGIGLDFAEDEGEADDNDFGVGKAKRKGRRQKKDQQKDVIDQKEGCERVEAVLEEEQKETMTRGKKKKKQKKMMNADDTTAAAIGGGEDKDHSCVSCKARFDSKNKLFEHLKRTGHSVLLQKEQTGHGKRSKKDKMQNIK